MPITEQQRTAYQSELTTLLGQITTKRSEYDSALADLEAARAVWVTKKGELELLEQKAQDRRVWISG
jgi:flagellar biosynthesis chaperone FliJ